MLKLDAAAKSASGSVDDKFIGSLIYTLADPVKFELFANNDAKGMQIDLSSTTCPSSPTTPRAPTTPQNERNAL